MKILIRTISMTALGIFLFMIILQATMVEVTKQEVENSCENAINRTVNAWVKNRELVKDGEENLFFENDEQFYYFFYESLMVQFNKNMNVTILVDNIDVNSGLLDVEVSADYKGFATKEKRYSVFLSTQGRIPPEQSDDGSIIESLKTLSIGNSVEWANQMWTVVRNDEENLLLLYGIDLTTTTYGDIQYKVSNLKALNDNFYASFIDEKHDLALDEYKVDHMNTFNGVYMENGGDFEMLKVFPITELEAQSLYDNGYRPTEDFWTRTVNSSQNIWVLSDDGITIKRKTAEAAVKPAVYLNKNKVRYFNYNEDGEFYELENYIGG